MKELNLNELMIINGGTEPCCESEAYNNGHAIGAAIGGAMSTIVDNLTNPSNFLDMFGHMLGGLDDLF